MGEPDADALERSPRLVRVLIEREVEVVVLGEVEDPGGHAQQLADGDVLALRTPGRYFVTGSSRPIAPWSTSCRTTSAVRLLVTLPIRMWLSVLIGGAPSVVDAMAHSTR